jgi:hypothetical protein
MTWLIAVKNDKITELGAKAKLQSEERALLMQKYQNFEENCISLCVSGIRVNSRTALTTGYY